MDFDDGMPCGGYEDEDAKIKQEIKDISEEKEPSKQECEDCSCPKEKAPVEPVIKTHCKKCGKGRAVLLQKGDPICQDCLFKNIEYKCRLLLENSFKVRKDSNLLVCLSGGLNSICLVLLIRFS